jgi:hypothetical protein
MGGGGSGSSGWPLPCNSTGIGTGALVQYPVFTPPAVQQLFLIL